MNDYQLKQKKRMIVNFHKLFIIINIATILSCTTLPVMIILGISVNYKMYKLNPGEESNINIEPLIYIDDILTKNPDDILELVVLIALPYIVLYLICDVVFNPKIKKNYHVENLSKSDLNYIDFLHFRFLLFVRFSISFVVILFLLHKISFTFASYTGIITNA